jgi:endonuclease/exonuclease/phosphatase family metal-dependent hydrolase
VAVSFKQSSDARFGAELCVRPYNMNKILLILFTLINYLHANIELSISTANLNCKNTGNLKAINDVFKNKTDIIALIEWTGDSLYRKIIDENHYKFDLDHSLYNGTHGIGIISKKGFDVKAKLIKSPIPGPCRIPFGFAEAIINQNKIAIICCHVPPPVKSCNKTTDLTIKEIASWVKNGKIIKEKSISGIEVPVIILGDMNATPNNSEIKKLKKKGLKDVLDNKFGIINTWGPKIGFPKIIRIDYLLIPEKYNLINSSTFHISGSDHNGIKAIFQIK